MNIKSHEINHIKIAELLAEDMIIGNVGDATDLLGNIYYQGFDHVIIHQHQITPDFFDLKTGVAGDILQKFSNYRVRLAIVGDFQAFQSKSMKDFIFESNKMRAINFVGSVSEALAKLSS